MKNAPLITLAFLCLPLIAAAQPDAEKQMPEAIDKTVPAEIPAPPTEPTRRGEPLPGPKHITPATSQPLATQIAVDILKQGGSAVDAAIAADAALGLMEPVGAGVGGDLFAIIWDPKTQKLYGLNASGRSPKSLSLQYFQKQGLTH